MTGNVGRGFSDAGKALDFLYARGRAAAWLPSQAWEELLARPLDEVRAQLGLTAPPAYTQVRTTKLRARGIV